MKTPDNADRLAELAPFTADYPIEAQGTRYYLCRDRVCSRPVEQISELKLFPEGAELKVQ